jgi:VRR-NUC domain-containing protein
VFGVAGLDWVDLVGALPLGERLFAAKRPRRTPEPGQPAAVRHIQFGFRQWDGPVGDWKEHFGKGRGQVYSLDGTEPLRSCNEVELARRLRTIRDHGYWFSEYNPSNVPPIWRPWVRSLRDQTPGWLRSLDTAVRQLVPSKRGGMPDVVAWNQAEPLRSAIFVECKGPRETFGEAQEDWVWAARQEGVELSQIAVSVRPF